MSSYKQKQLDKKAWGDEPEWDDNEPSKLEILKALNWYNYMKTVDDAAKWLSEYKGKKISPNLDIRTLGFLARMKSRGCKLPKKIIERIEQYHQDKDENENEQRKSPSRIQTHVLRAHIDEFIDNKENIDIEDFIRKSSFPMYAVQDVLECLIKERDEIDAAMKKKDPELVEAYSVLKKRELKEHKTYLDGLIEGLHNFISNQKRTRKPRKQKSVPASKKVKDLKYCEFNNEYNIQSLAPEKLIGAKEVWVYHGSNNAIAVITSDSDKGIDVRGTTLYNCTCKSKRCGRSTSNIIHSIVKANKRSLKKIFNDMKSKEEDYTTRFNDKTVILRIF